MSKRPPQLPGRARVAQRAPSSSATAFGDLADSGRLRTVALDAIAANPHQPRGSFDEAGLQGLADTIRERGILQPPVVRETPAGYELVAGERRCRAARIAGLSEVEVLVRDHDDADSLQDALLENVAREDLSPIEAARAYATIIEDLGITREELGRRIGQSRVSVSNHLRLLDLPQAALELLDNGDLTFAHGRALLLCDDHATRIRLARQAASEGWSTRQLEQAAHTAGAPRARRKASSADRDAFATRLGDAVSAATGLDLKAHVTASGTVTITVPDQDTATALATRLGAPLEALQEAPLAQAGPRPRKHR